MEALEMQDHEIIEHFQDRVHQVQEGEAEAKGLYADLYVLIESLEELRDEIKGIAIDELEQYNSRDIVERNGFAMKVMSKKTYSYKKDEEWKRINKEKKERENLMKQAINTVLYDDNGEQITAADVTFSKSIRMDRYEG